MCPLPLPLPPTNFFLKIFPLLHTAGLAVRTFGFGFPHHTAGCAQCKQWCVEGKKDYMADIATKRIYRRICVPAVPAG